MYLFIWQSAQPKAIDNAKEPIMSDTKRIVVNIRPLKSFQQLCIMVIFDINLISLIVEFLQTQRERIP